MDYDLNNLCFELVRIPNQQHAQVDTNQMHKGRYNTTINQVGGKW